MFRQAGASSSVARFIVLVALVASSGAGCGSSPKAEPTAAAADAGAKAGAEAGADAGAEAGADAGAKAEPAAPGEDRDDAGQPSSPNGEGVSSLVQGYREPGAEAEAEAAAEPSPVPAEFASGAASGIGALPTGPLAKVGAVEIPMSAFVEIYALKVAKYREHGRMIPPSADRRYRKAITERLIDHELLAQEAKRLGVEYDPAALEERKQLQREGIRDWTAHLRGRGESDASLEAMLIAELREAAILESLGELKVTAAEIKKDYKKIKDNWRSKEPRVRASHILVPLGPERPAGAPLPSEAQRSKWKAEAKKEAEGIYAEVTGPGADFAEVARRRSTGPSASKGGDIGIFTADRMAVEFSEVAFKLKVGAISEPVETKFGFHIIKLTGKWPPGVLPKEALEDEIRDRLRVRKLHEGGRGLIERLRREIKVVDNMAPTLGPEPRRKRTEEGEGEGESKAD